MNTAIMSLLWAQAESAGLASLYTGDRGLERDPRVLWLENFESGTVQEIGKRWGDLRRPENAQLSDDVSPDSSGKRSWSAPGDTPHGGSKDGASLYTHFRGVDKVHVRFYVKFPQNSGYAHHMVFIIADRNPTPWPKGFAGHRPAGDQFLATSIEPWSDWGKVPPPGAWNFYTYWQEMKADGRGDYWGNSFSPGKEPIPVGRWICVEAMVKMNSAPDAADGEQAFWVDGTLKGHFKGIRWRSTDELKINTLWLHYDVSANTAQHNRDPEPKSRAYGVRYDDVVVATDYIGPIKLRQSPSNGGEKK